MDAVGRSTPGGSGKGQAPHPWSRYVALGDSFTEGVGDPEEGAPHRGGGGGGPRGGGELGGRGGFW